MTRPSLRFRVPLGCGEFMRVGVFDLHSEFLEYARERSREPLPEASCAITLTEPIEGVTDRGCVAESLFTWRSARPRTIAHEAAHVAFAAFRARGLDATDETKEEAFCDLLDDVFHEISHRVRESTQ